MKHLVVLGARNLGGTITDRFLADGWQVTAIARSDDTLKAIEARGARALHADVSEPDQLRDALKEAGEIDLVVNAVSVFHFDPQVPWGGGPLVEATLDRYHTWTEANIRQAFVVFSEVARALAAQQRPSTIVQVTNSGTREATAGTGLWAAGWHGVRALATSAGQELQPYGIHVAQVLVNGPIESPKTQAFLQDLPADQSIDPAEVAAAVAYLTDQSTRGRTHEVTLTPGGNAPASW